MYDTGKIFSFDCWIARSVCVEELPRLLCTLEGITQYSYRVFPRDVRTAMLAFLNKGTAAMLVSLTNPPGIEPYSYANVFFCFW